MAKKYILKQIGTIYINEDSSIQAFIELDKKYLRALKNLNTFSHIHLFYIDDDCLKNCIVKINNIQNCFIYFSNNAFKVGEYILFDIKPYMPSEDTIIENNEYYKNNKCYNIILCKQDNDYIISEIGLIRNENNQIYLELDKVNINKNTKYLKVFWWFSKFDSKMYRDVLECKPSYGDLDKVGIFSTRSPVRPNPIAMTIIMIKDIIDNKIFINDIEAYDKTPCLGFEEYNFDIDLVKDVILPEYLKFWPTYINFKIGKEEMNKESDLLSPVHDLFKNVYNKKNNKLLEVETDNNVVIDGIYVKGARENNLKGIDVKIPYNKITAVVGVSGSGKSSLVNDTIYLECKRKMEFLNHTRNILSKPNVEEINGCIPCVIIKQDEIRGNSLSTVGTYVNIFDYLRIIYANLGVMHCDTCFNEISPLKKEEIHKLISNQNDYSLLSLDDLIINNKDIDKELDRLGAIYLLINNKKILLQTTRKCYHCNKVLFDLSVQDFSYINPDSRCPKCNGLGEEFVVDEEKLIEHPNLSLYDGASDFYGQLKNFIKMPNANWMKGQVFGLAALLNVDLKTPYVDLPEKFKRALIYGDKREVTFSFNNKKNGRNGVITRPVEGLKSIIYRCYNDASAPSSLTKYMKKVKCEVCHGERLNNIGRLVTVNNIRYPQATNYSFDEMNLFLDKLINNSNDVDYEKIKNSINNMKEIINAAKKLGISYLKLSQVTSTLSGGESQRLKLLGASINHLSNILYIFDEPSKGLDPRDYGKVIEMMQSIKKENNTIIIVEHNEDMIKKADNIIEIGPEAGVNGGRLVGEGSLKELIENKNTQISKYWNKEITKENRDVLTHEFITMNNLNFNNLKNIMIKFPINGITTIYGVSGSGKSSLMNGEIYPKMLKDKRFNEVIIVDQTPIGKNSKSIVATYISIMDDIRKLFSETKDAHMLSLTFEHFSFNNEVGQCEMCKGNGRTEVKYLENTYIQCPICNGKRYKKDILKVKYNNLSIDEVLNLSIIEGQEFLKDNTSIKTKLDALEKVGLGYLKIGQVTSTLSGGEASRLKIASCLINGKRSNTKNLYLLDEPTTGLHFSDIENLTKLLKTLVDNNNTIIAIEHNQRFVKISDWKIELGPGAASHGGEVVYMGK